MMAPPKNHAVGASEVPAQLRLMASLVESGLVQLTTVEIAGDTADGGKFTLTLAD